MHTFIKPKTITLKNRDDEEKEFIISRLPATVCREIMSKYPLSNLPKVGEYAVSEEAMLLLMKYVAVMSADQEIRLTTKALIDNHVDDGILLARLEIQMLEYNTGFFGLGDNQGFLDCLLQKFKPLIMQMLIQLSAQSSAQNSQRTPN